MTLTARQVDFFLLDVQCRQVARHARQGMLRGLYQNQANVQTIVDTLAALRAQMAHAIRGYLPLSVQRPLRLGDLAVKYVLGHTSFPELRLLRFAADRSFLAGAPNVEVRCALLRCALLRCSLLAARAASLRAALLLRCFAASLLRCFAARCFAARRSPLALLVARAACRRSRCRPTHQALLVARAAHRSRCSQIELKPPDYLAVPDTVPDADAAIDEVGILFSKEPAKVSSPMASGRL